MRAVVSVAGVIGHLRDQFGTGLLQPRLGLVEALFAEVVVLIEDRELLLLERFGAVLDQDVGLGLVVELPGVIARLDRLRPLPRAARRCDVRHTRLDQVVEHGDAVRRPQTTKEGEDFVLFDHLLDQRHGLGRVVLVILLDVAELAAVDPALLVEHLEVGLVGLANGRVDRGVAAQWQPHADQDLGIRDTGLVGRFRCRGRLLRARRCGGLLLTSLWRRAGARGKNQNGSREQSRQKPADRHTSPLGKVTALLSLGCPTLVVKVGFRLILEAKPKDLRCNRDPSLRSG